MNLQQIVAGLTAERDLLDKAIAALNGISAPRRRGRPPKNVQIATRPKRRPLLSAAARKKLSRLLKQRWAQGRMKRAKASKAVRRMSRAARKRIAAAQRARWAKVKAQQQAEGKVA